MGFGWSMGDMIAISGLTTRVYSAYKDAPDGYSNIADEAVVLQTLINKVAQHLKSTAISSDDYAYSPRVLNGCKGVLEDLNSLINKSQRLFSTNKRLIFISVKLGPNREDIEALWIRLISDAVLLRGFVGRFVVTCVLLFLIL